MDVDDLGLDLPLILHRAKQIPKLTPNCTTLCPSLQNMLGVV
jgi:hypothetical protein